MNILSNRVQTIQSSPTLEVTSKVELLKKKGIEVISLSVGEPDFDVQHNIKKSIIKALENNKTKYTAVDGITELKNAIKAKYSNLYNLEYDLDDIIISNGGKQVIYNLFASTLNPGDEVIIPSPYWVSYPDIVKLCGGKPIITISSENNAFKITPEILEKAISDRTKWIIINSPSNPTGQTYSKLELLAIAKIIEKYPHINILTDDIYEHILYEGSFYNLAMIAPHLKERTFIISGVSKTYSMTGLRIGYGLGNKNIIKAMKTIQSQSTSNPSSISQYGAVEAISCDQKFVTNNNSIFKERRDFLFNILNTITGIRINIKPSGSFYLFPSCVDLFGLKTSSGKILNNSIDFACFLLEEANVAIIPGIAFGCEGYFRISYAVSKVTLETACLRIKKAISTLQK